MSETTNRRGRGRGKLRRGKDSHGKPVYVGDWIGPDGKRHRRVLSSDKQVAERMLAKLVRERDLEAAGLAVEDSQERGLSEVIAKYETDLATYRRASHVRRVKEILARLQADLGPIRVRDATPERMLEWRGKRLAPKVLADGTVKP